MQEAEKKAREIINYYCTESCGLPQGIRFGCMLHIQVNAGEPIAVHHFEAKHQGVAMLNWLKNKALRAASKSQETELREHIQRIRGMSDDEVGFFIAGSAILRMNFMTENVVPPAALDLSLPRVDSEIDLVPIKLGSFIREFQKMGQPTDAAFAMTWLHSVRALCNPDIRVFGREMWTELARGKPYARGKLDEMEEMTGNAFLISDEDLLFVPVGLEPL